MTVYFTSDPHWGHDFMARYRGFESVQAHDLALLENFQALTTPDDQIWWLGDLAMGNPAHALAMTSAIDGHHHLITGNHDKCHPMHRDSHKWQHKYLQVFESVQAFARRRIALSPQEKSVDVLLSHFPYLGADDDHSDEARYPQYRLPDEGEWLIHGHTHFKDQRVHGHQIHVGLDAHNLRPVPLEYLAEMLRIGKFVNTVQQSTLSL